MNIAEFKYIFNARIWAKSSSAAALTLAQTRPRERPQECLISYVALSLLRRKFTTFGAVLLRQCTHALQHY